MPKLTPINTIGKYNLLQKLEQKFNIKNNQNTPITSKIFIENIDFDLTYFPLKHIGYKTIVSTITQLIAKRTKPKYATIAIAASSKFTTQAIEEIYKGINLATQNYNTTIVEQNITPSNKGLIISTTILGEQKQLKPNNPQKGNIICITGNLGTAYIGLQILIREKKIYLQHPTTQPKLEQYTQLIEKQLKPEPPINILDTLQKAKIQPTYITSIQNGLASSLIQTTKKHNIGIQVYENKIPITQQTYETALSINLDPITCAFNGGEDHEILFTITPKEYEKIKNNTDISFIGYITNQKQVTLITKSNKKIQITAQGWQKQAG